MKNVVKIQEVDPHCNNRRNFLKISGMGVVGAGLLMAVGCNDDDDPIYTDNQYPGVRNGVFDLGGGDLGILSYAYALEQLEADFYTKVVNASQFNSAFSQEQRTVLTDLYNHEVIHREFFRAALTGALPSGATLLPDLAFDYGSLDFNDVTTVLGTAKALEDTGVAAYNGAGRYITNPDYLLLAGKIVSVEARHASAIRTLINFNSVDFAGDDVVDTTTGLDQARKPSQIISEVSSLHFIQTTFTAQFLQ
ncbi:MAG TPA: ferritin-like domain-containing protein [Flavobacterium sp.]|nr:ferritin-like domain-containing protein [Flavobacterium sp.]